MPLFGGSHRSPTSTVPSANKILGSAPNYRIQRPHKIGYPKGWRKGDTEAWYKSQPTTKFTHLQYRKEREGPFYPEYIVVELDNNTVCRFDRRGDIPTRFGASIIEAVTAEDTAHVIQKHEKYYRTINDNSDMVLRIHFPNGQDLLTILGICYGVQEDDETRVFTLTRYNCYFFSWIIITAITRRTVDWALLGKDTNRWEELVRTTIEGSNPPALSNRAPSNPSSPLRRNHRSDTKSSSDLDPISSLSATYIINILHQALPSFRYSIQKSLEQLLLRTTIEPSMREISQDLAGKVAAKARRNYASRVALDAAMGAVVESMWATVLYTDNGREVWRSRCLKTEEAVQSAASAAANADERGGSAAKIGPEKWEQAWDAAWSEKGDKIPNGRGRFNYSSVASDRKNVCMRAKEAWRSAWDDACEASKQYVRLLSDGITAYVAGNLPDSLPEGLRIDMGTGPKTLPPRLAAMGAEPTNSKLQEFIQGQIVDLCLRAGTLGATQNPAEIEEAMRRVWVETIKVLDVGQN
ncbi:hypothetical protein FRC10_001377 [Ceratobasidium sp. 414]|nr:hypothetical protein FRC10_001377 [Ceratobasidium sp. 414]